MTVASVEFVRNLPLDNRKMAIPHSNTAIRTTTPFRLRPKNLLDTHRMKGGLVGGGGIKPSA